MAASACGCSPLNDARIAAARATSSSVHFAPPALATLRAVSSTSWISSVARATASSSASDPVSSSSVAAPMAWSARRAVWAAEAGVPSHDFPADGLKRRFFASSFLKCQRLLRSLASRIRVAVSASTRKRRATKRDTYGAARSSTSDTSSGLIPSPPAARYAAKRPNASASAPTKNASKRCESSASRAGSKRSGYVKPASPSWRSPGSDVARTQPEKSAWRPRFKPSCWGAP